MPTAIPNNFITDADVIAGYTEDGSGEVMTPDYLVRPASVEEVVETVKFCNTEKISITPTGARTCDTAAGLTQGGVCLSTERMKRILEVNADELYAVVEPGIYVGELKKALRERNLFYPPDPSSENIAMLGGTVATNAAGARSYKYGATSNWVIGMEVVLPDGTVTEVRSVDTRKATTGPRAFARMSDLWVGSEGVLGVFTKIYIRLLPSPPSAYAIMAFFPSMDAVYQFAIHLHRGDYFGVSPRSIEYMDNTCLELLRKSGKFPQIPAGSHGAVIVEQEHLADQHDETLECWLSALEQGEALVDDSIVADTEAKIVELRSLRHYVPATVWEKGKAVAAQGGRKVSTDWAVRLEKLPVVAKEMEKVCAEYGFGPERTFRYAHLGDGHPHYNFVPETHEETERCFQLRIKLSEMAVSHGGTVAAEHGIGKHRKNLLALEGQTMKQRMLKAVKGAIDPNNIMAPGNLL